MNIPFLRSLTVRLNLVVWLVWLLPAAAQPAYVNYQAYLTQADGSPVSDGSHVVEFNIYNDATGADVTNRIWGPFRFDLETGPPVLGRAPKAQFLQGRFNVILGEKDASGRSIADAFGGSQRFIEIKVDNGQAILPRHQFLSAPYALNAAGLARKGTNTVLESGNLGIGTASPLERLDVQGNVRVTGKVAAAELNGEVGSYRGGLTVGGNVRQTVVGTGKTDNLIFKRRFGPLNVWATRPSGFLGTATGISSSEFICSLAGFDFGAGDLQEDDKGPLIQARLVDSNGSWVIHANMRTHNGVVADSFVDVICFSTKLGGVLP